MNADTVPATEPRLYVCTMRYTSGRKKVVALAPLDHAQSVQPGQEGHYELSTRSSAKAAVHVGNVYEIPTTPSGSIMLGKATFKNPFKDADQTAVWQARQVASDLRERVDKANERHKFGALDNTVAVLRHAMHGMTTADATAFKVWLLRELEKW